VSVMKLLVSVMIVVCALSGTSMAKSHQSSGRAGVFGKINGKVFKAPQPDGAEADHCVKGFTGTVSGSQFLFLAAIECAGRGIHSHPIPRFQLVDINCASGYEAHAAIHPPQDLGCFLGTYEETGHRGQVLKVWDSVTDYLAGESLNSAIHMHIDSIEGDWVRGSFSGGFDQMCDTQGLNCSPTSTPVAVQSASFYVQVLDMGEQTAGYTP
jgi:hypothetical protein